MIGLTGIKSQMSVYLQSVLIRVLECDEVSPKFLLFILALFLTFMLGIYLSIVKPFMPAVRFSEYYRAVQKYRDTVVEEDAKEYEAYARSQAEVLRRKREGLVE